MTLAIHPEVARLSDECVRLESEIARTIERNMELAASVIPQLEAEYLVKIGMLQHALLVLQCDNQRRRRKMQMMRAALNRGEEPCVASIESALDEMFAQWETQAEQKYCEIEQARALLSSLRPVDPELVKAVKRVYRELVKRLHPDLNPDLGEKGLQWWLAVQSAYEEWDLPALQDISVLLDGVADAPLMPDRIEALRARRNILRSHLDRHQAQSVKLHAEFPLNIREQLSDAAWVAQRSDDTRALIEHETAAAVILEAELAVLSGLP